MAVQVKDILHENHQFSDFSLSLELLSLYFPRLSFLTPVNILIKNYPMKNLRFRQAVYAGDMKSPKLPSQNHYLEVYVN
jgi:hypothetical protein